MARKRPDVVHAPDAEPTPEKAKRRQIDFDDLLYRKCGAVAMWLGMSVPEYVHQRMTETVEAELPGVMEQMGIGSVPKPTVFPPKKE